MDVRERQFAERQYRLWKDFFLVTTSYDSLRAPLKDLKLFVDYITYLQDLLESRKVNTFPVWLAALCGAFGAILCQELIRFWVAH